MPMRKTVFFLVQCHYKQCLTLWLINKDSNAKSKDKLQSLKQKLYYWWCQGNTLNRNIFSLDTTCKNSGFKNMWHQSLNSKSGCGPMSTCCATGHLWVGLSPVSLFVRNSPVHVVLLYPQESQWRIVEDLARTPVSSGWVCSGSNSPELLTHSITQKRFLTGMNETKHFIIVIIIILIIMPCRLHGFP